MLGIVIIIVDIVLRRTKTGFCIPPLAVGMGIYLPPAANVPLVIGAVIAYFVHKHLKRKVEAKSAEEAKEYIEKHERRGVLFSSGLIVGESLMGVIVASIVVASITAGGSDNPLALVGAGFAHTADILGLIVSTLVMVWFVRRIVADK